MERVLLVDVDSKIPNLALMKLSAWHKAQGDICSMNTPDPTRVYASVVFKKNVHRTDGLRFMYPDADVRIGGSGHDLTTTLPPEVEAMTPDYSLYPNMDYSMGFTSRGCVRNCHFCVVPKKEGRYVRWHHPEQWVRHSKAKLLDNNWYADRDWFMETSQWFIDRKVQVDVTQGMDIRLIDEAIATRLKQLKWSAMLHFAFDDDRYTQAVLDGIALLKKVKINTKGAVYFYVYCDSDAQYENALARCQLLREHRTGAFVMFNCDAVSTQRIRNMQRWANIPQLFWKFDIDKYDQSQPKNGVA